MKHRLQKCLALHPILGWSETIGKRKMSLASAINETPFWTMSAFKWNPDECSSMISILHEGIVDVQFYDGIMIESLFSCVVL